MEQELHWIIVPLEVPLHIQTSPSSLFIGNMVLGVYSIWVPKSNMTPNPTEGKQRGILPKHILSLFVKVNKT